METTVVKYRKTSSDSRVRVERYEGRYSVGDGGIIIYHSELSSTFLPYSQIESIEQTFTTSMPKGERLEKSLVARHRRR